MDYKQWKSSKFTLMSWIREEEMLPEGQQATFINLRCHSFLRTTRGLPFLTPLQWFSWDHNISTQCLQTTINTSNHSSLISTSINSSNPRSLTPWSLKTSTNFWLFNSQTPTKSTSLTKSSRHSVGLPSTKFSKKRTPWWTWTLASSRTREQWIWYRTCNYRVRFFQTSHWRCKNRIHLKEKCK